MVSTEEPTGELGGAMQMLNSFLLLVTLLVGLLHPNRTTHRVMNSESQPRNDLPECQRVDSY